MSLSRFPLCFGKDARGARISHGRRRLTSFGGLIIFMLMVGGCALPLRGRSGTVHHVILGIGVVSTPAASADAISVVKSQSLGLALSDEIGLRVSAGYAQSVVTSTAPATVDAVVEVSGSILGPIRVTEHAVPISTSRPGNLRKDP